MAHKCSSCFYVVDSTFHCPQLCAKNLSHSKDVELKGLYTTEDAVGNEELCGCSLRWYASKDTPELYVTKDKSKPCNRHWMECWDRNNNIEWDSPDFKCICW